jgi:hypothetical protein
MEHSKEMKRVEGKAKVHGRRGGQVRRKVRQESRAVLGEEEASIGARIPIERCTTY